MPWAVHSGERHENLSNGSHHYWDAVAKDAHGRKVAQEFPAHNL